MIYFLLGSLVYVLGYLGGWRFLYCKGGTVGNPYEPFVWFAPFFWPGLLLYVPVRWFWRTVMMAPTKAQRQFWKANCER